MTDPPLSISAQTSSDTTGCTFPSMRRHNSRVASCSFCTLFSTRDTHPVSLLTKHASRYTTGLIWTFPFMPLPPPSAHLRASASLR